MCLRDGVCPAFSLEELQSCQKYASIDLMKFYNESHRGHKDVNWEISFIKSLDDLGVHEEKIFRRGDIIFSRDDPADRLFLLSKGSVCLTRRMNEECTVMSTNFIGSESLQPRGVYSTNCIANDDDTKLLIFKQDDIAHNITPDLVGSIMQMVFKSHMEIEKNFTVKKLRRMSSRSLSVNIIPREGGGGGGDDTDSGKNTPQSVKNTPRAEVIT